jgi:cytoskeletal protein CcmA (bactofilin family)
VFNRNPPPKPPASEDHYQSNLDGGDPSQTEYNDLMSDQTNSKNTLSADVEIKGSIKFQNELVIDGKVEGEITSAGVLTVGENAEIRG